tara:strand:+ start:324 stop:563 length:240 start_codon:yes stop_codon:yes gene_type:complete
LFPEAKGSFSEGGFAMVYFRHSGLEVFIRNVRNVIHVVKKYVIHFGSPVIDVSRDSCIDQKERLGRSLAHAFTNVFVFD